MLTLLDLADHYSGLPKQAPSADNVDDFLLKTGVCLGKSSCRHDVPAQSFLYSNWAVGVLGNLLALHDGFSDGTLTPWEKDNDKTITAPLGMTETRSRQDWLASDPTGFLLHRAVSGQESANNRYVAPAGGLYSSAHDMLLWLRYSMGLTGSPGLLAAHHLLYDDPPLRPTSNANQKIGLVWDITSGNGVTCISKAGDGQGFHAYVIFVKGQKRGAFLLVNNTPTTSYRSIATEILNALPATPGAGSPTCPVGNG